MSEIQLASSAARARRRLEMQRRAEITIQLCGPVTQVDETLTELMPMLAEMVRRLADERVMAEVALPGWAETFYGYQSHEDVL